jgi:hypothetical protein
MEARIIPGSNNDPRPFLLIYDIEREELKRLLKVIIKTGFVDVRVVDVENLTEGP